MAYIKQNWSEMQAKEIPVEAKHFEHIEESLADVINKVGDVVTTEVATWHDSVFELGEATHLMTAVDKLPLEENKPYTIILTDENDEEYTYELTLVDSEAVNGITGYKMLYFGDLLLDLDKDVGFALIQDGVAVDENCTIKSAPHKTGVLLIGYKKAVVKGTHATKSLQKVIVQDEEYAKALQDKIDNGIKKAYRGQVDALHKHLEDQINKLDAETSEKFEVVDNKLNTFEEAIENHTKEINDQVIEINDQVIDINGQLLKITDMLENTDVEHLAELRARIDSIDNLTVEHTSQINNLEQQSEVQAEQISTLNTRTENLNTFVATLETQTDALGTRTTALETTATELQNKTDALETSVSELQTDTENLESRANNLDTKTDELTNQIADLQTRASGLKSQTTELASKTETLEGQVATIQTDYALTSVVETKDNEVLTAAKAYTDLKAADAGAKVKLHIWEEND